MTSEVKVLVGILIVIGAGGYGYYMYSNSKPIVKTGLEEVAKIQKSAGAASEPGAQFPVPKNLKSSADEDADNSSFTLPKLAESDESIASALAKITDKALLEQLFNSRDFIRSVVVTVDNLTKENIPPQFLPVKPPAGDFLTDKKGKVIAEQNYQRYDQYISFAEKVDLHRLERLYVRYYPLFQQVYLESNGSGHFNDRLVEVLDSLLKTPEVRDPIHVKKDLVAYKYIDHRIESLNAGQKILIRIGPKNSEKMREILKKIRAKLAHLTGEF